jgi:3-hydroxyisobutyrate dehydrogenase-like beta-hydroxyacid dehydrogenase
MRIVSSNRDDDRLHSFSCMTKTIGFIGVGLMGRGMARSLIRKGYTLRVYNRTRAKADELTSIGAEVATTPAEAVRGAAVIVTMLADPAAVMDVMQGDSGILSAVAEGVVLIDSSTISPPASLEVRRLLQAKGADMIDAPVFGSKNEAEKGELGFIVGGEREVLERVQDVLDAMGRTLYVGANGMGAYAKLVVNLVIASTLQAFSEGMVLGTKAGIAPELMLEIIQSSRARSGIIEMKAPQILKRDFTPFFPLALMAKDLRLVVESAEALNLQLPFATALKEIFASCASNGLANEDMAALIKPLEKQAQVEVKATSTKADR